MSMLIKLINRVAVTGSTTVISLALTITSSLAQTQAQAACRDAVSGLSDVPVSILDVSDVSLDSAKTTFAVAVTERFFIDDIASVDSHIGHCTFNNIGRLVDIDTLVYSGKSPFHFKDFGEVQGIGRFIAILHTQREEADLVSTTTLEVTRTDEAGNRTIIESPPSERNHYFYESTIGRDYLGETSLFPVLINSQIEQWWANCNTREIGRVIDRRQELPTLESTTIASEVSNTICDEKR